MDEKRVLVITSTMLSFSTFLGVLFALIYYTYQILNT
jgi:hypothetical protein